MAKILLVEDEQKIGKLLQQQLQKDGHVVDWASDGLAALKLIRVEKYELYIFDLMLPGKSGEQLLLEVKQLYKDKPVMALTAKSELPQIVSGLDLGFDDYLSKPFAYVELTARIRSLTRRQFTTSVEHQVGQVKIIPQLRQCLVSDTEVGLSSLEYNILEYLFKNTHKYVSAEELIEHVWESNYDGFSNVVAAHIKNIRQTLTDAGVKDAEFIQTKRGKGYRIYDQTRNS